MPIFTLPHNPTLQGMARTHLDITYSTASGVALKAAIITPWNEEIKNRPAIVFVQGSGWTCPDLNYEIPQLSELARDGYVVMTVTHRSRLEGHPFPAFLQDVKCAIRYLRAHADKYGVDSDRIGIYGTSSGGNTAMLVAMTGDDPRYKTEEYREYSDAVQCMVQCFGPTDLEKMGITPELREDMVKQMTGDADPWQVMREMSPCCIIEAGKQYPPMLLAHGDADEIVPFNQCEMMYDAMRAIGQEPCMIRVTDAPHEGSFWSRELIRYITAFLDAHLLW